MDIAPKRTHLFGWVASAKQWVEIAVNANGKLEVSDPSPASGVVVTRTETAVGNNWWNTPNNTPVVAVSVKAGLSNTGNIWVVQSGLPYTQGFPLDAGESLSMAVDNFNKVVIFIETNGDLAHLVGISR